MCGASCTNPLEGGRMAHGIVEQQKAALAWPCIRQELGEVLSCDATLAVVSGGMADSQLPKKRVRMVVQEVVHQGCGELSRVTDVVSSMALNARVPGCPV